MPSSGGLSSARSRTSKGFSSARRARPARQAGPAQRALAAVLGLLERQVGLEYPFPVHGAQEAFLGLLARGGSLDCWACPALVAPLASKARLGLLGLPAWALLGRRVLLVRPVRELAFLGLLARPVLPVARAKMEATVRTAVRASLARREIRVLLVL